MNVLSLFKPIKAFAFDVDGVLTDGTLYLMPGGEMVRRMNIRDGYALQLAIKQGYHVVVISGGTSEPVRERLNKLGVKSVFMQVHDKVAVLRQFMEDNQLRPEEVLYMGDDMPDYEVMQVAGLPCAPADACSEIKSISWFVALSKGGEGCAREVIEKVMKLNNHWHHSNDLQSR